MNPQENRYFLRNKLTSDSTLPLNTKMGEPFVNLYEGRMFFSGVTGGSYTGVTGQPNVFEIGSNVDYLYAKSGITTPYINAGIILSGGTNLYNIFATSSSS